MGPLKTINTLLCLSLVTVFGGTSAHAQHEGHGGGVTLHGDGKGEIHAQDHHDHTMHDGEHMMHDGDHTMHNRADAHAPIGLMGDHMMHKAGQWMVSYRYMHMRMNGNLKGDDQISRSEIVTTIDNPFSGPPTLRVVPTDMDMDMHMFGVMYAPTDWLTLMAMGQYLDKSMDHITYAGPVGTTQLGQFETNSNGFGDTRVSGLFKLYEDDTHHVHLKAGLSFPTGETDKKDRVLTPMNTRPRLRLPYPMQLGSGTYDPLAGLTYTGHHNRFGWGFQYDGIYRVHRDNNYKLGNEHQFAGWGSYLWDDWISTSFRATGRVVGDINGQDKDITAPVQTADPNFQGGQSVDLSVGVNLAGQTGLLRGHRLGVEFGVPVYQNMNGVQLKRIWQVTAGWQYAF